MRQPHAPSASAGNVKYILHENPPRGELERNACESKSGEFFGVQYPEAGRKFIPEDFVERRILRLRNAQGMGLNYLSQRYGGWMWTEGISRYSFMDRTYFISWKRL
ncbi:hypothetical protein AVEN_193439-1 [Araneus ventricosus]|uniref:Uncharacterized protein n=1 Tax=Araneus ventricosus TaxID=182803 RepID=A0A4Y2G569_ARAVE|nr:hypothetical protein AVEN_193439-1 [Araneus ventricosus]